MAHDVHSLVQFYDVNLHSQIMTSPDRMSCGCGVNQLCRWESFFDLVVANKNSVGTPYTPDLFTLQEVGSSIPGKFHQPCVNIQTNLNNQPSQDGATWSYVCTGTYGGCAVFFRSDSNGFVLADDFQISLTNTPNFKVQAVKLNTRNGDRHVGVASVHTNPESGKTFAASARNQAYNEMKTRWPNLHYIVAGDFNETGLPAGNQGLSKIPLNNLATAPRCNVTVDYVFVDGFTHPSGSSGNQQVIDHTPSPYSDHRALGVTLYW